MMRNVFLILLMSLSLAAKSQIAISYQLSAVSYQPSAISYQPSAISQSQSLSQGQSQSYLKSYWHSGLTVLSQPLHYDWKDWTVFAGVATATTFAFVYDDEIYDFVNSTFTNSQSNTISQYTDIFGEELFIVPSIALTYAVGAIDKNPRLKNLSLATLQSFIFAEVASAGIKVLTCRERPQIQSPNPAPVPKSRPQIQSPNPAPVPAPEPRSHEWQGPFATFESTSFVSGHATRAFALATTIAGFYPERKWVGVVSYSLATATSLGRVISKEHWTSDVIVGAALGYFIGRGVVKFNEKIGNINTFKIEPIATNYGFGIAVRF